MNTEHLLAMGYVETESGHWHKQSKTADSELVVCNAKPTPKRIRQSTKPLMNKLEQEWFDSLMVRNNRKLIPQGITFRLANGLRFTPDIFCFEWPYDENNHPVAWEVKGPWFTDDANAKLKMFASAYPEIRVILVWKDHGVFQTQRVLP